MVVSLTALRSLLAEGVPIGRGDEDSVRRLWWAALATLQEDLLINPAPTKGLWLASPLPALYEPGLLRHLQGWVWAPEGVEQLLPSGAPLLPGRSGAEGPGPGGVSSHGFRRLPLQDQDGTDPLLLLITPTVQVALALDGLPQARRLLVRFDAEVLSAALTLLLQRLQQENPATATELQGALQALGPLDTAPDLALRFWPRLGERLAAMAPSVTLQPLPSVHRSDTASELALLEALTHEVRTPLATIRTLIRSLLRRPELTTLVRQRLEQIDSECSEQIDRFGLIFLAAELQRQPGSGQPLDASELARTDLSALLQAMEPLWQRQLTRRDLQLQLLIDPELPAVLSDPSRLETMLGGLMDRFSRALPSGSLVRLSLQAAGPRLKLQLSSIEAKAAASVDARTDRPASGADADGDERPAAERVGPVLSWNPGTGSLQLSSQATRQLFHRLGGRLTERSGSTLTVYFPLADPGG